MDDTNDYEREQAWAEYSEYYHANREALEKQYARDENRQALNYIWRALRADSSGDASTN